MGRGAEGRYGGVHGKARAEREARGSEERKRARTLTGEHNGGGISAERILQQPSERGVPVRDVSFARAASGRASLSEGGYHVPQSH